MLPEKNIKRLRQVWLIVFLLFVASLMAFDDVNASSLGNSLFFWSAGMMGFLGWYLLVNFIFSSIAPYVLKPYLKSHFNSNLKLSIFKVILSKEAFTVMIEDFSKNRSNS